MTEELSEEEKKEGKEPKTTKENKRDKVNEATALWTQPKAKLKDEQYQEAVADLSGKRGRRSLLSGRKGGQGFMVQGDIQTRNTLGV